MHHLRTGLVMGMKPNDLVSTKGAIFASNDSCARQTDKNQGNQTAGTIRNACKDTHVDGWRAGSGPLHFHLQHEL